VPTDRRTTIPNDSVPISACFDDDPSFLNCEIAQPNKFRIDKHRRMTKKHTKVVDMQNS
jgi:hypothetical protein